MGRPKNLPDMQPLQNAYETLGYKGADLQKQLAPFQQMQNSRVQPLAVSDDELGDITLPPPKSLIEAATKAEALVLQNLERIGSAKEATDLWEGLMLSYQVRREDLSQVRPGFEKAHPNFWNNPEEKRKIADHQRKALAWQAAQVAMQNEKPDLAQRLLIDAGFSAGDIMTMNTGNKKGELPTLERRESTSKTALDPNPGYNQIRAALPTFYAGNVIYNPSTQQIEIKNPSIDPGLTEEITQTLAKAEKMYQKSLREEGGKIVAMTPTETLVEAQKVVRATRSAFNDYTVELGNLYKGKIKPSTTEEKMAAREAALAKLPAKKRALVIQRLIELGDDD
jgi:ribosomal protein L10